MIKKLDDGTFTSASFVHFVFILYKAIVFQQPNPRRKLTGKGDS